MIARLTQALAALGINAVPAAGWFAERWTPGTVLALYWFESLLATGFLAALIALHRRVAPCAGHTRYRARQAGGGARQAGGAYLPQFLIMNLGFSVAHGVFLGVIAAILTANGHGAEVGLDFDDLGAGAAAVTGLLLANFVADLPGLRQRPFRWIERRGDAQFGRVIVMHLSLIFGMAAVAFTGVNRAFFGVFLGLKTMSDLARVLPQWKPRQPPRWLCAVMDRVPSTMPRKPGAPATFAEFWVADEAAENARLEANDRRM